jgi:hypothetical protein
VVWYFEDDTGELDDPLRASSNLFKLESLLTSIQSLEPLKRCDRMRVLRRRDGVFRKNILRLVPPHADVIDMLHKHDTASASKRSKVYSIKKCKEIVHDNWFGEAKIKASKEVLALMAILSQVTSGQDEVPQNAMIDAKNARIASDPSSTKEFVGDDIREIIRAFYEAADVTVHGVGTSRVPRALSWRSSLHFMSTFQTRIHHRYFM